MRLLNLSVRNFRSFRDVRDLDLGHDVCLLYGKNGSGKTALFDALEVALTGAVQRMSTIPDATKHFIRAQSSNVPASISVRAQVNSHERQTNLEFSGADDVRSMRPLLHGRHIETYGSTCYLSQSTIRNLVTCDSLKMGRIVEAILIDEATDALLQGVLAANITRTSTVFASARKGLQGEEQELAGLKEQLSAANEASKAPTPLIEPGLISSLREYLRTFAIGAGDLGTSDEIMQALAALERHVERSRQSVEQQKADALARMSSIQALIERQKGLSNARNRQNQLQERRKEIMTSQSEAERVRIDLGSQISAQRETAAATEKLFTALKLLHDSQALSGKTCPICDQKVKNLEDHVVAKMNRVGEENRTIVERIESLSVQQSAADRAILKLNDEANHINRQLAEIENEMRLNDSLSQELLARYKGEAGISVERAQSLESARLSDLMRADETYLSAVQFCSRLSSHMAAVTAKAKGAGREIETIKARIKAKEDRLVQAKTMFQELDSYVATIERLRHRFAQWRTDLMEGFMTGQASTAFQEFFQRIAPHQAFSVRVNSARVVKNKAEVTLGAYYESDKQYEVEGIFSQAELNACAIALFLALATTQVDHPGILLLDDPVQNMDEIHIEELGQTLKLLKDTLGWQIIIAVHDLSVFNFFKRQLYPSRQGQSLCSYTLNPSSDGTEISTDRMATFESKVFDLSFGAA